MITTSGEHDVISHVGHDPPLPEEAVTEIFSALPNTQVNQRGNGSFRSAGWSILDVA